MSPAAATSPSTRIPARRRALPRGPAFWLVAVTTAMVPASSAPSPLYPVYQAEFGFSALTLTVIFAVYVFALMASLLTVGRLSDYIGRRVVLAGALARSFHHSGRLWAVAPGARLVPGRHPPVRAYCRR